MHYCHACSDLGTHIFAAIHIKGRESTDFYSTDYLIIQMTVLLVNEFIILYVLQLFEKYSHTSFSKNKDGSHFLGIPDLS